MSFTRTTLPGTSIRVAAVAASAVLALGLAACGDDTDATGDDTTTTAETAAETDAADGGAADGEAVDGVHVEDGWVRATDEEMTGVFGLIHNGTDDELHLVAVSSDLTDRAELHEVVPDGGGMQMQEKAGGFTIAAGEALELAPGGDHIMLMELEEPITPGQQVELTLEFADGSETTVTFDSRAFAGGEEEYVDDDHEGHGGHDGDDDQGGGATGDE